MQVADLKFPAEIPPRRLVTRRSDLSVCDCANVVRLRVFACVLECKVIVIKRESKTIV